VENSGDSVFEDTSVMNGEATLVGRLLDGGDFSPHIRRAFRNDLRKFALWFTSANAEPFRVGRITTRDH
jgi:hypothetical protein